jgi:uncharacterized protein (TIGR02246 family)
MRKLPLFALFVDAFPTLGSAGPKEDAYAIVEHWARAFNTANVDEIVGLYAPDATFWGTRMDTLATTSEAVKKYFAALPAERKVTLGDHAAVVLSDNTVVDAGRYEVMLNSNAIPARYTFLIAKRGDNWAIVHHHSSVLPK